MLHSIVRVTPLPNYRLNVEFGDGISGTIDLSDELGGDVFAPLRDEGFFRKVTIDAYGAVCWPGGPDLAPDAMYLELTGGSSNDARSTPSEARPSR